MRERNRDSEKDRLIETDRDRHADNGLNTPNPPTPPQPLPPPPPTPSVCKWLALEQQGRSGDVIRATLTPRSVTLVVAARYTPCHPVTDIMGRRGGGGWGGGVSRDRGMARENVA